MKKAVVFILLNLMIFDATSQCLNADSLQTSNITYINAQANWSPAPQAHHYLIHYREIGSSIWSNLGNIDSSMTSRNIPQLQPLTTYEWQIKTFCDSTNQPNSGWSYSDTFTTAAFIPANFNPIIFPIIGNPTCNINTTFSVVASQIQDEPDISSSVFSSDKGYFEINTVNNGDTVGNASYSSDFISFTSTLIVDFTLGPNYAKIDLIDSVGSMMGFFTIENLTDGIKVSSLGPNDGNNYTNGYISQIITTEVNEFVLGYRSESTTPVNLVLRSRFNPTLEQFWFGGLTELINGVTMVSIVLAGAALIREREHGTIEHLLVMPISSLEIMLSKVLATALVVLCATGLSTFLVIKAWMQIPIEGSISLFLWCTALQLFATTSMGIFMATIARSMPQFGLLLILTLLPLQLLSGGVTPRESMPDFIQNIMLLAPNTHFVLASQAILFRGAGIEIVWPQMLSLFAIGSALFLFSLRPFYGLFVQVG